MPARGPSKFVPLPSDWVKAATNLLWPIYAAELKTKPRLSWPLDREGFYERFRFPKPRTRDAAPTRGVKESTLALIAAEARIELDGLLHGIVFESSDPCAREIVFGRPPAKPPGDPTAGLKVFLNRRELWGDTEILHALKDARGIDMIALSAAVAETLWGLFFRRALTREHFECRLVLFDPDPPTEKHYNPFVQRLLEESSATKRLQARRLLQLAKTNPRLQIRVIRDLPLMYNLWLARDEGGVDYIGHLSTYFYDASLGGPAFRAPRGNPIVARLREEFDFVWERASVLRESRSRSKDWVKGRAPKPAFLSRRYV